MTTIALFTAGAVVYEIRADLGTHETHRMLSRSFANLRDTFLREHLAIVGTGDDSTCVTSDAAELLDRELNQLVLFGIAGSFDDGRRHSGVVDSLLKEIQLGLENFNQWSAVSHREMASSEFPDATLPELLGKLQRVEHEVDLYFGERRQSHERALATFAVLGIVFLGLLLWELIRILRRKKAAIHETADFERELRALLDRSSDRIYLLDGAARIVFANGVGRSHEADCRKGAFAADIFVPQLRTTFGEAFDTALARGKPQELSGLTLAGGGTCNIRLVPLPRENQSSRVILSLTDTADAQRANYRLNESEQKYHSLFNNAQVGLARTDNSTGFVTECNDNFAGMLGLGGPDACIGSFGIAKLFADQATRDHVARELQQSGEVSHVIVEYRLPGGETSWLNYSARAFADKGFTESVLIDVTRQRLAEQELQENTERSRLIFDESPTSLWELDLSRMKRYCDELRDSGITDLKAHFASNPDEFEACLGMIEVLRVNKATRELLGIERPKDLLSLHSKFMDEATIAKMAETAINLMIGATRLTSQGVLFTADGQRVDVIVDIRVPGEHRETLRKVIVAVTNVTEQRRAERELRDNRARLDLALRSVRDGLWEFFVESGRMTFDDRCAEIQNLPLDQLPRNFDDWQDMIHPDDRPLVLAALGDHLAGVDSQFQCEYRVRRDGGNWIWIYDRGGLAPSEKGESALKIIGTRSDIQARKCAEIAQRESEQRWRTIADNSSDYIVVTDKHGVVRYINRVNPLLGRRNVVGHNIADFGLPEYRERVLGAISLAVETGQTVCIEVKGKLTNGDIRQYQARVGRLEPRTDSDACTLSVTDVTEQRRTMRALVESEERFELAVKGSHDGLYDWYNMSNDDDMWWSPRLYEMFGCEAGTVPPSMSMILDKVHAEDRKRVHLALERHTVDRVPLDIDFRVRVKESEDRWYRLRGQALWADDGTAYRLAGSIRDETDRHLAEQALRDSEATLMSILTAAPTGIGIVSNRVIKWVSDELVNMLGYARDDMIGRSARFLYPTKDEFNRVGEVKYKQIREQGVGEVETQWVRKDGSVMDVLLRSSPIDSTNHSVGLSFTALDITAMKRIQRALIESEKKVQQLFDSMPDGMLLSDRNGTIIDANPALVRMLGFESQGSTPRTVSALACPHWQSAITESIEKTVQNGRAEIEIELTHLDGHEIPVGISLWQMQDESGRPSRIGAVVRDISLRRKFEEELIKREKLESVGQLAGGIAHDFNNLLTAILGNLSLARLDCEDPAIAVQLDDAERATERARSLTQQLLTFSRGGDPNRKACSVVDLVRESASFVLRGSRSRVEFDFEPGIQPILIDEGQITQVLYNLVINADQAMPDGGVVRIQASRIEVTEDQIPELQAGVYVCISVTDGGTGIAKERISRIFDPFFTTKPGGTGLGLATTYSIIRKHGGGITVDSQEGVGTTFRVYLRMDLPCEDVRADSVPGFPSGQGRVLFMDDEEVIRSVAGRALAKAGLQVEFAVDGTDAITRYRKAHTEGRPFDVVVLDLTIPGGMGGMETIAALRLFNPGVKAIVSSGYSSDPILANYREFGFFEAVQKPYKPQILVEAVWRLIGSESAAKSAPKPALRD